MCVCVCVHARICVCVCDIHSQLVWLLPSPIDGRKEKLVAKALETPEEKRARRLAKKVVKGHLLCCWVLGWEHLHAIYCYCQLD